MEEKKNQEYDVIMGWNRFISDGTLKSERTGQVIDFDTVHIYVAKFDNLLNGKCFVLAKREPIKIRMAMFADVVGVTFKEFTERFRQDFLFHPAKSLGMQDQYGKFEILQLKVGREAFCMFELPDPVEPQLVEQPTK